MLRQKIVILLTFLGHNDAETALYVGYLKAGDESSYLADLLDKLTPTELTAIVDTLKCGKFRLADVAHDIKGMTEHDQFFLPRVVGRNRCGSQAAA